MAPPFNRFMLPLLRAISDGKEHGMPSIIRAVSDELSLSEEQRNEIMPSKRKRRTTYVSHRLGWAKTNLQRAGLLEMPNRGYAKITQKGLDVLKDPPDEISRKYLQRFESYREWKSTFKRRGDNTEEEDEPDVDIETPNETIRRGFDDYRQNLHSELLEEISKIPPRGFEALVLDLLRQMRYGEIVKRTKRSWDDGIDGIVYEDELGLGKIYIQCKRYKNPVQVNEVKEFMGTLHTTNTKKGIFITTSRFTPNARSCVDDLKTDTTVVLMDGSQLVDLMEKNGVGVSKVEDMTINEIDQSYFEDLARDI